MAVLLTGNVSLCRSARQPARPSVRPNNCLGIGIGIGIIMADSINQLVRQ